VVAVVVVVVVARLEEAPAAEGVDPLRAF